MNQLLLLTILIMSLAAQQLLPKKGPLWVYFNTPNLVWHNGFITLDEVVINFQQAIPVTLNAQKAKVVLTVRTGNVPNWSDFSIRVRVMDRGEQFVHWTFGRTFSQPAFSYNSETMEIPCISTRNIMVKVDRTGFPNSQIYLRFIGYLPIL